MKWMGGGGGGWVGGLLSVDLSQACSPCSCYKLWTVSGRQRDLISGEYRSSGWGVGG